MFDSLIFVGFFVCKSNVECIILGFALQKNRNSALELIEQLLKDWEAGRDFSGLLYTDKLVHRRFTSPDNMTALWSEMKETLSEQWATMVYLFQWKVYCSLGFKGNVMDSWYFPRLRMPTVHACVYVCGNPATETDAVLPHPFCCRLSNFPFSISLMLSSPNNLDPFCISFSSQRHAKLANLSRWMV